MSLQLGVTTWFRLKELVQMLHDSLQIVESSTSRAMSYSLKTCIGSALPSPGKYCCKLGTRALTGPNFALL